MMTVGSFLLYSCGMGIVLTMYTLVATHIKRTYKDSITPGMKVAVQFCMWLAITSALLYFFRHPETTKFDAFVTAVVVSLAFLVHDTKKRCIYSMLLVAVYLFVRFYLL